MSTAPSTSACRPIRSGAGIGSSGGGRSVGEGSGELGDVVTAPPDVGAGIGIGPSVPRTGAVGAPGPVGDGAAAVSVTGVDTLPAGEEAAGAGAVTGTESPWTAAGASAATAAAKPVAAARADLFRECRGRIHSVHAGVKTAPQSGGAVRGALS